MERRRCPSRMDQRVAQALGGRSPQPGFAWPPANAINRRDPRRRSRTAGSTPSCSTRRTVNPSIVRRQPGRGRPAEARTGTPSPALLTSPAIEHASVAAVGVSTAGGPTSLPALAAEVSIRAIQDPDAPAVRRADARRATSTPTSRAPSPLIEDDHAGRSPPPLPVTARGRDRHRGSTSRLRLRRRRSAPSCPPRSPRRVTRVDRRPAGAHRICSAQTAAAQPLLAALPTALQRLGSAAWRPDVGRRRFRPGQHLRRPLAGARDSAADGRAHRRTVLGQLHPRLEQRRAADHGAEHAALPGP